MASGPSRIGPRKPAVPKVIGVTGMEPLLQGLRQFWCGRGGWRCDIGRPADAMEAAAQIRPILIALDAAAGLATGAVAAGVVGAGVAVAGVTQDLQPLLQANASIYNADGGGMVSGPGGNYYPAPKNLDAFPKASRAPRKTRMSGGRMRERWKDDKGNVYEWDYQHGKVEVYNKRGVHQGEYDPGTGAQMKPPDPTRKVEP